MGPQPARAFEPLGNGLINRTLRMLDDGRERVLQKLNTAVFRTPETVMRNCHAVTAHLGRERAAGNYAYAVLELVPTLSGAPALTLADASWWRMYDYVPDTRTHDVAADAAMAGEAARGFGAFVRALGALPTGAVGEVIPGFHDPAVATRISVARSPTIASAARRSATTNADARRRSPSSSERGNR